LCLGYLILQSHCSYNQVPTTRDCKLQKGCRRLPLVTDHITTKSVTRKDFGAAPKTNCNRFWSLVVAMWSFVSWRLVGDQLATGGRSLTGQSLVAEWSEVVGDLSLTKLSYQWATARPLVANQSPTVCRPLCHWLGTSGRSRDGRK